MLKHDAALVNTTTDSRFHLGVGDVHVWHAELTNTEDERNFEPLLSPDEKERAARFRFQEHRRRFVIARGLLRQVLAAYADVQPQALTFTYSEMGKPELSTLHGSSVGFNVSHSGDIAAFGFALGRRIGVDVECIRHDVDVDEIPRRFFSQLEQQTLAALEGREKIQGFFNCWTRKEAYVKAVGSGLSLPLRDFDVSLVPGERAQLLATRPDPDLTSKWSMASIELGEECAAAVVVEGPIGRLSVRHFAPAVVSDQSST
jgi:4'-phosphopantetheinyl transferase